MAGFLSALAGARRAAPRILVPLLLAGGLATAVSVASARDESGMYEMLLGRAPAPARIAPLRFYQYAPVERIRPRKPRPKIVRTTPPRPRAETVAAAAERAKGWLAVILTDETLRRGDVVVFPKGPRVFAGIEGNPPWSEGDFEDLSKTRLVGKKSRAVLLAMTGRIAAEEEPSRLVTAAGQKSRPLIGVKRSLKEGGRKD
jgi:hypothetical protein